MASPDCRPHSFDEQRAQATQSSMVDYHFYRWAAGMSGFGTPAGEYTYAPINVLSSGSLFSQNSFLDYKNLSLDAWSCYDGDKSIPMDITGTLYQHASNSFLGDNLDPSSYFLTSSSISSMLIVSVPTSDMTLSVNVSWSQYPEQSDFNTPYVIVTYGKPWHSNGNPWHSGDLGGTTFITGYIHTGNYNFDYNYKYNASSGSFLYFVLTSYCAVEGC